LINIKRLNKFIRSNTSDSFVQFIKYVLVGGIATLVHIILFHILAWIVFPSLQETDFAVKVLNLSVANVDVDERAINSIISNIIAFTLANIAAYIMNIIWVFVPGRHHRYLEFFLFFGVSALSVLIGSGIMGFLIKQYHWQTTYAFTVNIIVSLLFNYLIRKFYIFKK